MLKGIIFDLDNTLYDYDKANEKAINCLCDYVVRSLHIDQLRFLEAYNLGRAKTKEILPDCAATHSRMLYCQHALELLNVNPVTYALEMHEVFWKGFLLEMSLYLGVESFLTKLKNQSIKISICTDFTTEIQHRKIRRLGLDRYLDVLVTSEEVGIEKPNEKMFMLTLEKMGLQHDEVIMIGDDFVKDIKGALSADIKAIWYTKNSKEVEEKVPCFSNYTDGKVDNLCGIF